MQGSSHTAHTYTQAKPPQGHLDCEITATLSGVRGLADYIQGCGAWSSRLLVQLSAAWHAAGPGGWSLQPLLAVLLIDFGNRGETPNS